MSPYDDTPATDLSPGPDAQKYTPATGGGVVAKADPADQFAPDPYEEDEHKVAEHNETDNFSPAVRELMKK